MAVDLTDYTSVLRREITPLGSDLFADVPDDTLEQYLIDAFWEVRLDGFLGDYTADIDGIVVHTGGGEDISRDLIALIALYAGVKVLRNRILNMNTAFRAQAGPVEYEIQNSASVLAEMLKQLQATKQRFIDAAEQQAALTPVALIDAYTVRRLVPTAYGEQLGELWSGINTPAITQG